MRRLAGVVALLLLGSACTDSGAEDVPTGATTSSAMPSPRATTPSRPRATTPRSTQTPTSTPAPSRPVRFDQAAAMATVRHLAGTIGPREATGANFRTAAAWLAGQLGRAGYRVERRPLSVPAGVSWGVRVPAGRTVNVVATPPDADLLKPYLLVGAHLDTVPQAPGAEDNASGIAVLLELARMYGPAGGSRTRLPLVLVGFGAEEPRGDGDARHHYGSRAYVAAMPAAHRTALRGMVSLDRVGVGRVVPVCTADASGRALQDELVTGTGTRRCTNRSSDHWSFARRGMPGVRLGSTPYAEYHSARDLPPVVQPAQLARTAAVLMAWLG